MNQKLIAVVAAVIGRASRANPADAVLREVLREHRGISRDDGGAISKVLFAYYRWYGWLDLREGVKRQIYRALEIDEAFRRNPQSLRDNELRRAIPEWVAGEMDTSADWLRALQTEPVLWLRARPGQRGAVAEKLPAASPAEFAPDALRYAGQEDLFRTPEFHAGDFELQDLSSQMVGLACAPQPGQIWWDACAGEGGKTLHLCDLMNKRGLVWASDRAAWRLQRLKRRAARAQVFNYRSVIWDGQAKLPFKTKFDGVLIDAPCTGLGTWQRNPHARWTTRPEDVAELASVQRRILELAATALKPGGKLVYSVCTLTRRETTEVVEALTTRFPDLAPMPVAFAWQKTTAANQVWLWPQETAGNGMFIAAWRRRPAA